MDIPIGAGAEAFMEAVYSRQPAIHVRGAGISYQKQLSE